MKSMLCLVFAFFTAASPEVLAGRFIDIPLPDGKPVQAYASGPRNAAVGVLVVHDWFGISAQTRAAVDRLGQRGLRALAIDLYEGRSAATHDEANALMQRLMQQDAAKTAAVLQAALGQLHRPGRRTATLGFSMGGSLALGAALRSGEGVKGAAVVYGFGFHETPPEQLARWPGTVMTITGALDDDSVEAGIGLWRHARKLGKPMEMHVLTGAAHAYAQPLFEQGRNYDAEATRATWRLIDAFLDRIAHRRD